MEAFPQSISKSLWTLAGSNGKSFIPPSLSPSLHPSLSFARVLADTVIEDLQNAGQFEHHLQIGWSQLPLSSSPLPPSFLPPTLSLSLHSRAQSPFPLILPREDTCSPHL